MKTLAINICILPSQELKDFCCKIYDNDKSLYSSENLVYIPHITLCQKAFRVSDLKKLILEIKWLKLEKFNIELWKICYDNLLFYKVFRNDNLTRLQENILNISNTFDKVDLTTDSFKTENFFYEENINWVKNYQENLDIKNDLHITLWKDFQNIDSNDLIKNFEFNTIAICLMWNYCSVREIIEMIKV